MNRTAYRFDRFTLEPDDRVLRRDGEAVELPSRCFDALLLLVREQGRLVTKERFFEEVWRGVHVTDEALTQCVKTLRRRLGDSAAEPRFIRTETKHGYRFVAAVERVDRQEMSTTAAGEGRGRAVLREPAAAALGGAAAGAVGGLAYGLTAVAPGAGALSAATVLTCLTVLIGLLGGGGVGLGLLASARLRTPTWLSRLIGGAGGGFLVGGLVELLAHDGFLILFGEAPRDITGAWEGALLGAAVGLGVLAGEPLAARGRRVRAVLPAAGLGALAGVAITAAGGRLLGGSLDALATVFEDSRLSLEAVGRVFGQDGFAGPARTATGALEAALFVSAVAAALMLVRTADADGRGP